MSIEIEPEFLSNKSQNIIGNISYFSKTDRYFLGLKMKNYKKSKRLNYYFYPKYSNFIFLNTLTNFKSSQEILSFTFNTNIEIIKKSLFLDVNARNLSFFGNQKGSFTNINFHLNGTIGKLNWNIDFENVLNDRVFIRQTITPIFFISENNSVFGRFIKFSINYKFN